MRLGVYIGSFNPVHKGHISLVQYLIDKNYVDEVLIIPTQNYWDKNNLVSIEDRINMLKLLETDKIHIDSSYNDIPYTSDLMNKLSSEINEELFLIIGADNLLRFDEWHNYKELLNYNIIVIPRNNIDANALIKNLGDNKMTLVSNYKEMNISSTDIRNGKNREYLDTKVLEYIKKNNLYEEVK